MVLLAQSRVFIQCAVLFVGSLIWPECQSGTIHQIATRLGDLVKALKRLLSVGVVPADCPSGGPFCVGDHLCALTILAVLCLH